MTFGKSQFLWYSGQISHICLEHRFFAYFQRFRDTCVTCTTNTPKTWHLESLNFCGVLGRYRISTSNIDFLRIFKKIHLESHVHNKYHVYIADCDICNICVFDRWYFLKYLTDTQNSIYDFVTGLNISDVFFVMFRAYNFRTTYDFNAGRQ